MSILILLDLLSIGSAEAYIGWGGKLNGHLTGCCVRNLHTIYYQNQTIGFQVTVENVEDAFLGQSVRISMFWLADWFTEVM